MPPIALLTDFGTRDPYVGIMKGVILGINPGAQITDICHDIEPGDIRAGAFALNMAFPHFPAGTIFVCVIDPGVGTQRKMIAVEVSGKIIVCPDNGLPSWILKDKVPDRVVELSDTRYFLHEVSSTFHGRDVFSPVAAHLSLGVSIEMLGSLHPTVKTFPVPEATMEGNLLHGVVVYIDRFGNLITNIHHDTFTKWQHRVGGVVTVEVNNNNIGGMHSTYGDIPNGEFGPLFGSSGYLEIAANGGSAFDRLQAREDALVVVRTT